jgi:hypothetical protein
MQFIDEEELMKRNTLKSRMSVRNITEMNIKNKKSRDRRLMSSVGFIRPLLDIQAPKRQKANFCL